MSLQHGIYESVQQLHDLTLDHNYPNVLSDLPHGLQELYLDFAYKNSLDFLPQNLKYLDISYCREQDKSNLPNTIKKIIYEVLHGLTWLHRQGLVHGDLKLNNILIFPN